MYEYNATLIKIVDGDTIDVRIDLGFHVFKIERVRLAGINAPEMKMPGGPVAKAYLAALLPLGSSVLVQTQKNIYDRYGRYIAEVMVDSINVSQKMLESGNAVVYKG
jgi:micrococcal nuclease